MVLVIDNESGFLAKIKTPKLLPMHELIAIIAIVICLAAIGFVIKIYRESPKMKDSHDDD